MKCYGDDLAAVGVPDNQDRASELWNELKDLWERYETAHSEYFDSVNLSQSKLDSLHEQLEEHRGDLCTRYHTRDWTTTGMQAYQNLHLRQNYTGYWSKSANFSSTKFDVTKIIDIKFYNSLLWTIIKNNLCVAGWSGVGMRDVLERSNTPLLSIMNYNNNQLMSRVG